MTPLESWSAMFEKDNMLTNTWSKAKKSWKSRSRNVSDETSGLTQITQN